MLYLFEILSVNASRWAWLQRNFYLRNFAFFQAFTLCYASCPKLQQFKLRGESMVVLSLGWDLRRPIVTLSPGRTHGETLRSFQERPQHYQLPNIPVGKSQHGITGINQSVLTPCPVFEWISEIKQHDERSQFRLQAHVTGSRICLLNIKN